MRFVRKLVVVAVFVAVLVGGWQFAAQNSTPIQIHYLAGARDGVALWAALIGAFVVGGCLMAALGSYQVLRARMMTRRYRKLVAGLEAEVHQLFGRYRGRVRNADGQLIEIEDLVGWAEELGRR